MMSARLTLLLLTGCCLLAGHGSVVGYLSPGLKDSYIPDNLFQAIVEQIARGSAADSMSDDAYMDSLPAVMARASKALEHELLDYDSLLDGDPNPSLRDQEYLQHSSLWGSQYVSGGAGEGPHRVHPAVKTDAALPAYCNPPNPCPVGYSEEQGCITQFENTAAFSRDYQAAQECMCDSEHMFNCPAGGQGGDGGDSRGDAGLEDFLSHSFGGGHEHKNLVAKKFFQKKNEESREPRERINPFLVGEKLPIAAKKGINVN